MTTTNDFGSGFHTGMHDEPAITEYRGYKVVPDKQYSLYSVVTPNGNELEGKFTGRIEAREFIDSQIELNEKGTK